MSQLMQDPPFIRFLLNAPVKYDCYFLVGNEELSITVERIGGVQMMLLAHSEVFRTEFMQSTLSEKKDIAITDLYPDTFKNLLRFVYGYDNIASLSFEDTDNLFYAADKYMVSNLKDKLATRLMSLLTYDNICGLMNNPACYNMLNLKCAMTKILQEETGKVLRGPQFLDLNPQGFIKILEEDGLNVPEIELWRAAVKWAKHRANSEDGATLRQELAGPIQHIRVCTLTLEDFAKEVAPTNILTDREAVQVCTSLGTKSVQQDLTNVCNVIKHRGQNKPELQELVFPTLSQRFNYCNHSSFTLVTKGHRIQLSSFVLNPNTQMRAHQCLITIVIRTSLAHQPFTFTYPIAVKSGEQSISVPLPDAQYLQPNTDYSVAVSFYCGGGHKCYLYQGSQSSFENEHLKVDFISSHFVVSNHLQKLVYKTVN